MPKLLITAKIKNGHTHIVYLRDDGGGETSLSKGHAHQLMAGQIAPGPDGHIHTLTEYEPKPAKDTQTDEDKVSDVLKLYRQAKENEKEAIKKGEEAEKIYCNDQWPDNSKPKGDNRSAITVNVIKKNIDGLSGYQRQHRTDLRFLPTEDGDAKTADILNIVVKGILDNCTYSREETKVSEDVMIVGRGVFHLFIDREKNLQGDIVVERFPWGGGKSTAGIHFGPFEKDDLSDCDYIVKWKWYSEDKVKSLYPDQMDKIFPQIDDSDGIDEPHNADKEVAYQQGSKKVTADPDLVDTLKKEYKEIEALRREYKRVTVIVNADDEFFFNADGWSKADIDAAATISGIKIIPRSVCKIRRTKIMGTALLEDNYPDDGLDGFNVIPVFATKRRGEWWGKVEEVKELQYAINKTWSQFIDIINKLVAYGYYIDAETFSTPEEKEKFKRNSSSPGFVVEVQNIDKIPKKEEGVKFPNELADFLVMLNTAVKENMSINLELLGMSDGANQSGIAIRQKITQQLLGNDYIFDNMSFAKKQLGRNLVSMIQKLYTPERLYRIVMNQRQQPQQQMVAGQPLNQMSPQEIMSILYTADLTKYDVIISESSESPSAQIANFMLLAEMASKGIPIPPQVMLKFAPIPDKEAVMQMLAQSQAAQQESEKMKYDTELKKAVIAQQGKMMAKNGGMMPQGQPGGVPIG